MGGTVPDFAKRFEKFLDNKASILPEEFREKFEKFQSIRKKGLVSNFADIRSTVFKLFVPVFFAFDYLQYYLENRSRCCQRFRGILRQNSTQQIPVEV